MSGPLGSSQWMYSSGGFYPTEIDQSLMFDGTSYLSRTPSVAGNRKTWTFSTWFKRGGVSPSTSYALFSGGTGTTPNTGTNVRFQVENDYLNLSTDNTSGGSLMSSADLRDVSAWYHVVLAFDTPQASASDRIKMYINGEQVTSFRATPRYPTQNRDLGVNNTELQQVGGSSIGTFEKFNGYLADTYLVDGTALDPTSFGEFKSGVWIPKAYTGSYGTNGFHLEYDGNANDSSGTGNNWTATNIVAGDYMLDSPTNNFATLNPLATSVTLSEGNLKASGGAVHNAAKSTMAISTGMKVYVEVTFGAAPNGGWFGLTPRGDNEPSYTATDRTGLYSTTGSSTFYGSGAGTNVGGPLLNNGDTWGMAVDFDNGRAYFCKITAGTPTWYARNGSNGSQYAPDGASDNLFEFMNSDTTLPLFVLVTQASTPTLNFGQTGYQNNSVPDGFLALSTANLPEPSISPLYGASPQDHFNTVLYTGNGGTQTVSGVGFEPDFTWVKQRGGTTSHWLNDAVRGAGLSLASDTAEEEKSYAAYFTAFNNDGFSLAGGTGGFNATSGTYVAWNWKASNAASVLNEDGSIDSQVSANTTAGFSIVSYTGTGADNATIGHSLNSTPSMIIAKSRSVVGDWRVWHQNLPGAGYYLTLNITAAQGNSTSVWGTSPAQTSTTFTIGTNSDVNTISATYLAYCFHDVEGYSKFGSYTGNGSLDGTFVYTGFRPAFILFKNTSISQSWVLYDTARDAYNAVSNYLLPDLPNGEGVLANADFLSNGFKLRWTSSINNLNNNFIYMAFAENPFKYANAR